MNCLTFLFLRLLNLLNELLTIFLNADRLNESIN